MINKSVTVIQLNRVSFAIPTPDGIKTLIRELNLSVSRGEWLGIAGANGSGKSTLAKLIAKLAPVSAGEVIHHRNEGLVPPGDFVPRKPFVQMIFQNPDAQMIGETVYEDVCFGLDNYGFEPAEKERLAMHALDTTGLAALVESPAHSLSGGQKQLLHAAGCLAVQPEVLVFDEATAMLDPMSRQQLLRTVRRLNQQGTTIVWITQLMDELAECDRIVALDAGRIVYDGSKEGFFYASAMESAPICEQLGFFPPYAVQVAQELMRQGVRLTPPPLTIEQLGKAVDA